jgi:hypothetical protein
MFIRNKEAQEGYIHICEGKTETFMRKQKLEILRHDVSNYAIVFNEKGKIRILHLKFCPYCGCNLDNEVEK